MASYIRSSTINDIKKLKGPITTIIYGIKWKHEGPFQVADLKQPKLLQLEKV